LTRRAASDFRRLETWAVRVAMGCHLLPSRCEVLPHSYLGLDQAIKASWLRVPLKAILMYPPLMESASR
jgi:hypothetical protein